MSGGWRWDESGAEGVGNISERGFWFECLTQVWQVREGDGIAEVSGSSMSRPEQEVRSGKGTERGTVESDRVVDSEPRGNAYIM